MSYIQRFVVSVTTIADGSATAYSPHLTGKISQIRYVKTDYAAGVDFTITAEATGETIWAQLDVNASVTVSPRQPTHTTAGVAAGAGILDMIGMANDRVKIVIAAGGDTKTGVFHIILE
jgi:hypothetical protein